MSSEPMNGANFELDSSSPSSSPRRSSSFSRSSLFPFLFNVILSFSNANLYHIRDWRLIGFAQYVSVFQQQLFWSILLKTVIWTVVNIVFHVVIGVFLAVVLHQKFIRGKSAWRVALILPWALAAIHHRAHLARNVQLRIRRGEFAHHEISPPLAGAMAHFTVRSVSRRHHHQHLARVSFHDGDRARRSAIDSRTSFTRRPTSMAPRSGFSFGISPRRCSGRS